MFQGINFLAVIVAALIYFGLGALWYSPVLFSKPFMKYRGMTEEQMQQGGGNPVDYLFVLIVDLVVAFVLAVVIRTAGAATAIDGALAGVMMAVGFAATSTLVYTIFSGPHKMLWVIYSAYQLVAFAIMGAILAVWR